MQKLHDNPGQADVVAEYTNLINSLDDSPQARDIRTVAEEAYADIMGGYPAVQAQSTYNAHNTTQLQNLIDDAQFFVHNRTDLDKANLITSAESNAIAYDLATHLRERIEQVRKQNPAFDISAATSTLQQLAALAPAKRPSTIATITPEALHEKLATLTTELQQAHAEFENLEGGPSIAIEPGFEGEEEEETEESL